jgi:hypothetical protein
MADSDFLQDRKKALEEQFFAKQNRELLEKLRSQDEAEKRREALAEASGIRSDTLLDHLIAQNITAETFAALSLIPLVAVAWADGAIQGNEREAILKAAAESGMSSQDSSYQLLEGWLAEAPGPDVLDAWKEYIQAFASTSDSQVSAVLKDEILGRARAVAESAGGILGIGKVSLVEEAVLQELEGAFA